MDRISKDHGGDFCDDGAENVVVLFFSSQLASGNRAGTSVCVYMLGFGRAQPILGEELLETILWNM